MRSQRNLPPKSTEQVNPESQLRRASLERELVDPPCRAGYTEVAIELLETSSGLYGEEFLGALV